MKEEYFSDEEFDNFFSKFENLRFKTLKDLPIKKNLNILDLATGYGYYAIEIAKFESEIRITGIDISKSDVLKAKKNVENHNLSDRIEILKMDASEMKFPDEHFDMVCNFLGLEDIHMTRGRDGVEKTFSEVNRVLRQDGFFCFVAMPPDLMETRAQITEVALFSYICDATWLEAAEYEKILEKTGFKLMRIKNYCTHKKLTPKQAKEEIKFACENVPKIYGVKTQTCKRVWEKFGRDIENHGLGHYSKVISFTSKKLSH